uniref:Uncharacterized protein n=1 Tax=Fagus sylvatica TaxID=28930 RepID=A0A2N9IEW1_FAGSY
MAGEKFKKLKKPIQGMAIEVEAEFNAANVEEFPKRCAWKIEMESMRRQLDVLTEQFQKYKPPPTRTRTCCSTTKREPVRFGKKKIQDWSKMKTKLQEQFMPFNYLQTQFARRTLQYQSLGRSFGSTNKPEQQPWKSKNAQPVALAHTSNNVATKTSFVGKPNNSNLSCKHYKYGEESHKSIECKKPALQAKNKTLMTETMEEESDAANGSNIPMQQLVTTAQCSNWQQHSSTAAFQCSEGMMKGILMIEENQEDYLQEPVYDQYQEAEEVSEGILMIEEIVEQPPVYDIKVEAEIGDDQKEGITLEGMMTFKPVSNQFVLQNMDATTNILQVSKEEMEEKKRPASKISHTTCSREDRACDLLIEGSHCSLHTREHHYTLRPKDTTKSKPMVKIKKISQERLLGLKHLGPNT